MAGEPSSVPATPPGSEAPSPNPSTGSAKPRRRTLLIAVAAVAVVAIVVVALVLVLGIGGFHLTGSSSPPVTVRVNTLTLDFLPANEPCFGGGYQSTHALTVVAGGEMTYNVSLTDANPNGARGCTVTNLTIETKGFQLVSSNLPVGVGSGTRTLSFTLGTPASAFNGSVVVYANVTYQSPNVQVTAQNFQVTGGGGGCGSVSASGVAFSGFSGGTYNDSALVVSISPQYICSVTQISVDGTAGFTIGTTNLPVQLPIDSFTSITFELHLPSTAYQGALNYTVSLS